jgi:hypothetical protein
MKSHPKQVEYASRAILMNASQCVIRRLTMHGQSQASSWIEGDHPSCCIEKR